MAKKISKGLIIGGSIAALVALAALVWYLRKKKAAQSQAATGAATGAGFLTNAPAIIATDQNGDAQIVTPVHNATATTVTQTPSGPVAQTQTLPPQGVAIVASPTGKISAVPAYGTAGNSTPAVVTNGSNSHTNTIPVKVAPSNPATAILAAANNAPTTAILVSGPMIPPPNAPIISGPVISGPVVSPVATSLAPNNAGVTAMVGAAQPSSVFGAGGFLNALL